MMKMIGIVGVILFGTAMWILLLPAGAATVGEVRWIAGLCGLLIGVGASLVAMQIIHLK